MAIFSSKAFIGSFYQGDEGQGLPFHCKGFAVDRQLWRTSNLAAGLVWVSFAMDHSRAGQRTSASKADSPGLSSLGCPPQV
ncbi:hypothetical protein ACVR05_08095 [Streptococcus caprae]|uniref:Uncharacterized protein n=1 Tax=Streptococcus caprae TaxID=1640501 RepID=A0ABV8CSY5_9STRE